MGKRKACPFCESLNIKPWAAGKMRCRACNRAFSPRESLSIDYVPANPRVSTRRQADKQEKAKAKLLGVRQTIASGQTPIDKADLKGELLRVECKYTDKKSFTLKQDDLVKVGNAASVDQMPVFMVEFRDKGNTYYIVEEGWFLQLLEAYRNENKHD